MPVWHFAWSQILKPNMTSPIYPWVDMPPLSSTRSQTMVLWPLEVSKKRSEPTGGVQPHPPSSPPPPPLGGAGGKGDDNQQPPPGGCFWWFCTTSQVTTPKY